MKPDAIIVNTARGLVIDETAMVGALSSGKIAGAGLDVFADEPLLTNSPLLGLNNVILSPHVAAATFGGTMERLWVAIDNIKRFIQGDFANAIIRGSRV